MKRILALILVLLLFAGCGKTPGTPKETQNGENVVQEAPKKTQNDTQTANDESAVSPEKNQSTASEQLVSEESVKAFVLALIQGASEDNIREFKKEKDDGKWVYDIKVVHNGTEYEFEIDAQNGQILNWDSEPVKD